MLLPLRNPVRTYAWGSRRALAALRGAPLPSAEPEAELWLGAHPRAPSEVEVEGRWQRLDDWLAARGESLPFLLKVLAAEQPLSLQAHPDREQAARGFAREQAAQVPRDAPERRYPDPHAKPELVVALEPFRALCGLRPVAAIRELGARLALPVLDAALAEAARAGGESAPGDALLALLALPGAERARLARAATQAARPLHDADPAYALLTELAARHPDDVAVLAPLFLEALTLAPGEGLFLPAGRLHAYLGGVALELQAPSDNVLRAGLTPKPVDVPALAEIVERRAAAPSPLPSVARDGERLWPVAEAGFELSWRSLGAEPRGCEAAPPELLLALDASAEIEAGSVTLHLERGEAALLLAPAASYRVRGSGRLVRARSLPGAFQPG